MRSSALLLATLFFCSMTTLGATAGHRALTADDINAIKAVSDPQLSPDGQWVAYSVRTNDVDKDERTTHLWMTAWDGKRSVQLTNSAEGEHMPRWSPDGKSLAFLSSRGAKDGPDQLWLLNRLGGEATVLTSYKGSVVDYTWSPDGKRVALVVQDEDRTRLKEADKDKTPPPLVIDRYYFKEDKTEYLGAVRQHLYVLDVASRNSQILTPGRFDESVPTWSPDSKQIAFASKRSPDPDRDSEFGLYVIAADPGSEPRLLTRFQGESGDSDRMSGAVWRPDGKQVAFVGAGDPKLIYYSTHHLFVVPAAGGTAQMVTGNLDRNVAQPRWSADGKSMYLLVEDDLNQHLARLNVASGKLERLLDGRRETTAFDIGARDRIALLDSTVAAPDEVFALDGKGAARNLSNQNEAWLRSVTPAAVENVSFASKDGTPISGFVVTPPGYVAGRRYPTILQIHGGPVSQFANSFAPVWQILASQGYVVVAANPRGSSGRGEAFATAISADAEAFGFGDALFH